MACRLCVLNDTQKHSVSSSSRTEWHPRLLQRHDKSPRVLVRMVVRLEPGGGRTYPVINHLLAKYRSLVFESTRPNGVATGLGKEDGNGEVGSSGLEIGVAGCVEVYIAAPFVAVQCEEVDAV